MLTKSNFSDDANRKTQFQSGGGEAE